jgi:hypothetical protein
VNFAEQLAYWYLRLNGFFPLTNFVLHRHDDYDPHSSDADIVAVRFPHVYEPIGGQSDDWDPKFRDWDLTLTEETIGLIVEVKSGRERPTNDQQSRMEYAVGRLGMFTREESVNVAGALCGNSTIRKNGFTVAKLFKVRRPTHPDSV